MIIIKKFVGPLGILVFLLLPRIVLGQSYLTKISGTISEQGGSPIFGATVLLQNTNAGVVTESDGSFELTGQLEGEYILEVSYMGYKKVLQRLTLESGKSYNVDFSMKEDSVVLNEVTVTGKSTVQQVRDKAFNVGVVDTKKLHTTTLDIGHALDRISGVRVRESGGVGSQMNFSINGFRGKQVRFFIDGVPMDNFGSAFQLNNIPVNLSERIEVYKGVVPVGLGSDALGRGRQHCDQ